MKFKFCGDQDAPDWVLAEMATISKISSVRVKLLLGQILKGIIEGTVDYEKIVQLKVGTQSNLEVVDVEASIAGLHFILTNAAKHDLEETTLARELQQLGMPKEHSDSICRTYAKDKDRLQQHLRDSSLKLGTNLSLTDWKAEYTLATNESTTAEDAPTISVSLRQATAGGNGIVIDMTETKFQLLLHELKVARSLMEDM
uniref:COMM domain-containing protein n=1 Tax=Pyramimonas obovata TaxID=1411642 RepID=A0A7S0QZ93_9CHLO|mmetsp:Transcript_22269/g.48956  ORF Transcript_22269/g.48956 Transcript_22269/m.48956 type:complete len:200 (+) Transcript_22269:331-930(+)|eukprot:CAMPEP_0118955178 /NCGR_PEP_ID=MMETSP1169-20130426/59582_1 /TAXON_ID=36882 /ORGANISM="Pyramimonas obovata, Strain CCMP722" /LENGTH=199 /DNA_ID=CAMNT_0006902971 /DNA_START=313 /DNA_END=912 /DNA_ORIENTATION=+